MTGVGTIAGVWLVGALMLACAGSSEKKAESPAASGVATATEAKVAPPVAAGGPSSELGTAKKEEAVASPAPTSGGGVAGGGAKTRRPFANTSQEATEYIDEAVETRHAAIDVCVGAARERRKTPHVEVSLELGIDQEGTLIGVKAPKGTLQDKVLFDCIRDALVGAPFPRSKAGVITLKKTFSDQVIRR